MFSELFKRCLLGDRIACTQLFLQVVLQEHLENLFKRMGLEPKLIILPKPQPGSPPFELGKAISERNFIRALRAPSVKNPALFPKQLQKEALENIKAEIDQMLVLLNQDLKELDL